MSMAQALRRGLALLLAAALGAGCSSGSGSTSAGGDLSQEAEAVFGSSGGGSGGGGGGAVAKEGWTIILMSFTGDQARAQAEAILPKIHREAGLTRAYIEDRREGVIIAHGRYRGPSDARAQEDLSEVREVLLGNARAFPTAFLAPLAEGGAAGSIPELNLARAKELFGDQARYTLQIAVYESENRREAMAKAEQAAATLRREGDLAFYYHGPTRSMVTIGVFDDDDFDPGTGMMSPDLAAARERHPHNLYNGTGIEVRVAGRSDGRLQPSGLVQIP